jgi:hypothetical protein
MTTEEGAKKKVRKKKPAGRAVPKEASAAVPASRLTGMQSLALWELVLEGDGKTAKSRFVSLDRADLKGLESAGMITIVPGPRKKTPTYGEKVYLTDAAWEWANRSGLEAHLARTPVAARVLQAFLSKVKQFLEVQELALDHLLRPRRPTAEPEETTHPSSGEHAETAPPATVAADMEQRIRAAYLRVTQGALNEYVRLALLRAELAGEPIEAVDAELRAMQQRGNAVLYPIDDPQRIRPEDDAAAMRVSGERRDLLCIMR